MRFLLKVTIPTEAGNAGIKSGNLMKVVQSTLQQLKPEAAYFTEIDGKRTGFIVTDLENPSQIPAVAEPFFLGLNATVEFHPAMTAEDLMKAGPGIEQAVKTYGSM